MAKRRYASPMLMTITPGEDPIIVIGGSLGTSGYDSPYSFDGISQEDLDLIDLNCDDMDLQDMDADGDYIITSDEFAIWLEARGGW